MPAASALTRVASPQQAVMINIAADVQDSTGATTTVRIEVVPDLLPLIVALAGGHGLPTLDAAGSLVLGGISTLSTDSNGHLVIPAAVVPETANGFVPVAGSGVVYTDGGIFKRAL